MKNIIAVSFASICWLFSSAQIEGPLSGGTFTVVAIPGSNQTWTTPANVAASDNLYTSFGNLTGGVGGFTDYLVTTNFGFTIPSGSTISGIIVESERADPNFRTSDHSIRIVKAGVIGSTERSVGSGYPSSDSYQSYGNAGDLWGETWAPADINNAGFGVAIAARRSVAGGTTAGRVDHIRIIVFYDFTILPVRLINFSATKNKSAVLLNWTTAEESNMNYYILQRSLNNLDYADITSVRSENQITTTKYQASDNNPFNGTAFYRLKTIEYSGITKYSKVISINFEKTDKTILYPTSITKGAVLNINNPGNKKLAIRFYTTSGQLISNINTNSNQLSTEKITNGQGNIFFSILNEQGKIAGSGILFVY
jgi:hypothetical protein